MIKKNFNSQSSAICFDCQSKEKNLFPPGEDSNLRIPSKKENPSPGIGENSSGPSFGEDFNTPGGGRNKFCPMSTNDTILIFQQLKKFFTKNKKN